MFTWSYDPVFNLVRIRHDDTSAVDQWSFTPLQMYDDRTLEYELQEYAACWGYRHGPAVRNRAAEFTRAWKEAQAWLLNR